ncbi:MAG TPA: hypothetical protein VFP41_01525 [Actinomycetota bacterium]|nr:hypothetical protein [Actinomycetota bacterium]
MSSGSTRLAQSASEPQHRLGYDFTDYLDAAPELGRLRALDLLIAESSRGGTT